PVVCGTKERRQTSAVMRGKWFFTAPCVCTSTSFTLKCCFLLLAASCAAAVGSGLRTAILQSYFPEQHRSEERLYSLVERENTADTATADTTSGAAHASFAKPGAARLDESLCFVDNYRRAQQANRTKDQETEPATSFFTSASTKRRRHFQTIARNLGVSYFFRPLFDSPVLYEKLQRGNDWASALLFQRFSGYYDQLLYVHESAHLEKDVVEALLRHYHQRREEPASSASATKETVVQDTATAGRILLITAPTAPGRRATGDTAVATHQTIAILSTASDIAEDGRTLRGRDALMEFWTNVFLDRHCLDLTVASCARRSAAQGSEYWTLTEASGFVEVHELALPDPQDAPVTALDLDQIQFVGTVGSANKSPLFTGGPPRGPIATATSTADGVHDSPSGDTPDSGVPAARKLKIAVVQTYFPRSHTKRAELYSWTERELLAEPLYEEHLAQEGSQGSSRTRSLFKDSRVLQTAENLKSRFDKSEGATTSSPSGHDHSPSAATQRSQLFFPLYVKAVAKINQAYCKRHNYAYIFRTKFEAREPLYVQRGKFATAGHFLDGVQKERPHRAYSWGRILLVWRYLPFYDYVLIADLDAAFVRPQTRIETLLYFWDPSVRWLLQTPEKNVDRPSRPSDPSPANLVFENQPLKFVGFFGTQLQAGVFMMRGGTLVADGNEEWGSEFLMRMYLHPMCFDGGLCEQTCANAWLLADLGNCCGQAGEHRGSGHQQIPSCGDPALDGIQTGFKAADESGAPVERPETSVNEPVPSAATNSNTPEDENASFAYIRNGPHSIRHFVFGQHYQPGARAHSRAARVLPVGTMQAIEMRTRLRIVSETNGAVRFSTGFPKEPGATEGDTQYTFRDDILDRPLMYHTAGRGETFKNVVFTTLLDMTAKDEVTGKAEIHRAAQQPLLKPASRPEPEFLWECLTPGTASSGERAASTHTSLFNRVMDALGAYYGYQYDFQHHYGVSPENTKGTIEGRNYKELRGFSPSFAETMTEIFPDAPFRRGIHTTPKDLAIIVPTFSTKTVGGPEHATNSPELPRKSPVHSALNFAACYQAYSSYHRVGVFAVGHPLAAESILTASHALGALLYRRLPSFVLPARGGKSYGPGGTATEIAVREYHRGRSNQFVVKRSRPRSRPSETDFPHAAGQEYEDGFNSFFEPSMGEGDGETVTTSRFWSAFVIWNADDGAEEDGHDVPSTETAIAQTEAAVKTSLSSSNSTATPSYKWAKATVLHVRELLSYGWRRNDQFSIDYLNIPTRVFIVSSNANLRQHLLILHLLERHVGCTIEKLSTALAVCNFSEELELDRIAGNGAFA
ncbi:unnamed protein product, partial [Amoebophrya sp. A120]